MTETTPLRLFNSLTRSLETFEPVHPGEARVYSCGPTVYNYPHIGNMRAYVFADTLGRTLSFKGYKLAHVINITDVGHLTDDADAGEDKLEKAASERAQSIWDIAKHYTQAYWDDVRALNIRGPMKAGKPEAAHWSIATDYVPQMIDFAKSIATEHCYELPSGLYFDVATVMDYGRLARDEEFLGDLLSVTKLLRELRTTTGLTQRESVLRNAAARLVKILREKVSRAAQQKYLEMLSIWEPVANAPTGELEKQLEEALRRSRERLNQGRIEPIEGKRNDEDFAIWRKTPPGETRQMEWDSPWGRGAPGWHLECSVMSRALLGLPFDIHTGGIDHREIHHPNEIAQNQAIAHTNGLDCAANSGARIWMHNNFLIDRSGKMSKSSGEFLRLQLLIDRGFHPLAYRLLCLQAHYRSELEFSWDNLAAAFTRLKRMVMAVAPLKDVTPAQAVHQPKLTELLARFDGAICDDLNTPVALTILDEAVAMKKVPAEEKRALIETMDGVLGLDLLTLTRADLRVRPRDAILTEARIEAALDKRQQARAAKDFATSDAIRDDLIAKGVEVMDGDPLRWDWRPLLS